MSVFKYFGVDDIRFIRHSDRFNSEIRPQFNGEFNIAVNDEGKTLTVIGHHRDHADKPGYVGIYSYGTEGQFAGICFRSQMTV